MGQLATPRRQPDGGDPIGQDGRLGVRRVHRGAVADAAMRTMDSGAPQLLDFGVTNERAWEVGLACGGKVKVFVERLA